MKKLRALKVGDLVKFTAQVLKKEGMHHLLERNKGNNKWRVVGIRREGEGLSIEATTPTYPNAMWNTSRIEIEPFKETPPFMGTIKVRGPGYARTLRSRED